ncbi:MAG: hypothetical protein GY705_05820, partial [Bacteroidetes bacterium]|nr:hypothetical protein [Bacteroidota bacterium]
NPLSENIELFKLTYQLAIDTGNMVYAPFALAMLNYSRLSSGENLFNVSKEMKSSLSLIATLKNNYVSDLVGILSAYIEVFTNLDGKKKVITIYEEKTTLEKYPDNAVYLFFYNFWRCQALFYFGKHDCAFNETRKYFKLAVSTFGGLFPVPIYTFYYSLTICSVYSSLSEFNKKDALEQLNIFQKKFKKWSGNCSENFLHQYLLIEAEISRITGKEIKALALYDKAIEAAEENGFIQHEALGNELAAKFWLSMDKQDFADLYLKKSHYLYTMWGAKAKVADLELKFPQLLASKSTVKDSSTIQLQTSITLDLASVMKASQTLSGEIVLSRLLANMMRIVIENAGAERGLLLLPQQDRWF